MTYGQRLLSAALCIVFLIGMVAAGSFIEYDNTLSEVESTENSFLSNPSAFFAKDSLELWYADDALTNYLTNMATDYYEETGIQIVPRLQTGLEYLEDIYEMSVRENPERKAPDLYILGTDKLEKAYLEGLAWEVADYDKLIAEDFCSKAGVDAVTYHGKKVGYPFYFETSAMLYNKTYVDESKRAFPETINDLLDFADAYDAPDSVESVFKWDTSDIFYNYYIAGNYLQVGGDAGDDKTLVNVNNEDAIACLDAYKSLNEFFYIERGKTTYESIIQDFMEGKMVFTVATSDCVATIERAKQAGEFEFDYGVTTLPNISAQYKTRSLSQTEAVVINGYSTKRQIAEDFAKYITFTNAEKLYEKSGKMTTKRGLTYDLPAMEAFYNEYDASIGVPKLMGAGNYWINLEVGFSRALDGEDSQVILDELQETLKKQIQ